MNLLVSGATGCLLGIAYFGHLWLHVRRVLETGRPSFHRSALLRLAGVGIGLVLLGRTGGANLVAGLAGLYVTRTVLLWRVGRVTGA